MDRFPRVVVFDVLGTIVDLAPVDDALARRGLPAGTRELWLARVLRDGFALAATGALPSFLDLARHHLRALLAEHVAGDPAAATEEVLLGLQDLGVHEDVGPALAKLRDIGLRVAALTNGSASLARRILDDAGLLSHFEHVFDPLESGGFKPRTEPYLGAARALDVAPEEMVLVSQHPWDVHGAASAGAIAAWVQRGAGEPPPGMLPPAISGADLVEVVDRLATGLSASPAWQH